MKNHDNKVRLFLVDDNAVFIKSLELELMQNADFDIETYDTAKQCVENLSNEPDIIILDYHLDGIHKNTNNGLKTLIQIKALHPKMPVLILSTQDTIEVAVNCMHHRAFDYVVKSETAFMRIQKLIETIFHFQKMEKELNWYMDRV